MQAVEQGASELRGIRAMGPAPMRSRARDAVIRALGASGSLGRARRGVARSGDVVVLTFHRIVPDAEVAVCRSPRGMVLRESLFARLIEYLGEEAVFVSPQDLDRLDTHARAGHRSRPRILLTFDDGWLDNAVVALPYLERAQVRACFFVPTGLTGRSRPFWPERVLGLLAYARKRGQLAVVKGSLEKLRAVRTTTLPYLGPPHADEALLGWLKQFPASELFGWSEELFGSLCDEAGKYFDEPVPHSLPDAAAYPPPDLMERLMTWNQLRALTHAGHSVGSHTCTHAILPPLDQEPLAYELQASRNALWEHLPEQRDSLWVSYPNGSASPAVLRAASDAGYRYGFSNAPGVWRSISNPFLLPRVNVWDGTLLDSSGAFCKQTVEYSLFWRTIRAIPRT